MTSANQQQLWLQCVDVVDHGRVWSADRNQRYVTLSGCRQQSHISFGSQTPFLSTCAAVALSWLRNGSVLTIGVGKDGNRELGLWDHLPVRSWSPQPTEWQRRNSKTARRRPAFWGLDGIHEALVKRGEGDVWRGLSNLERGLGLTF